MGSEVERAREEVRKCFIPGIPIRVANQLPTTLPYRRVC